METLIKQLLITDPDLAEWIALQESSFGQAIAKGYTDLEETSADKIQKYCELIRKAGQEGPTLGRIMATCLVPVLKYGNKEFLENFLHTADVMLEKGSYTLNSPLESLAILLNSKETESASAYLGLLCDTFSQDLSYNQSLHLSHTLPKAILSLSPLKRTWQTEQLRRVIKTNFRLADPFIQGMHKGLHLLSQDALACFVCMGLEKFRQNEKFGAKFLSLESELGTDTCADMQVTVSFSQVQHQLNRYLRARTGIGISVRPLSEFASCQLQQITDNDSYVCSDGKYIYLPDEISFFDSKEENINLYKCLAKLESAYYEFDTSEFDLEKLGNWKLENENWKMENEFEKFFLLFPIKELASDLFTIFEHGRIRILLNRFYPGIVRQSFPMLQREAVNIFKREKQIEIIFLLYAWIGLGISKTESFGMSSHAKKHAENFADIFEKKIHEDYTVRTSGELVLKTCHDIEYLIRKTTGCESPENFYIPLKTPFGRRLYPGLFFSAYQNYDQIAEKIKTRLEKKGLKVYKSDVRKRLMENHGLISAEDIREILQIQESGNSRMRELDDSEIRDMFNSSVPLAPGSQTSQSGSVYWYREWDCNLGDYLHDHARVSDRVVNAFESGSDSETGFYYSTLARYQGLVKRIRYAFELLKPEGLAILRRWTEGDEFDYRALLNYVTDKKAGITPSERLYIKRLKQQRDVAVLLLADLSRSTSNLVLSPLESDRDATVLDVEKEAVVLFCEALQVVGDAFAIAGFSGTGRLGVDYLRIKDFDEDMNDTIRERINAICPQRNTRMGAAIRHAVCQIEKIPAKVRLLIILGDGFPNDTDYKKDYAIEDTRKAIFEASSKNIHARAITVNIAGDSRLDDLYGSVRHNVISDVRELPDKLLRIYSALTH